MKMMDVIRLAKANNPALVHCSNVWASRNDNINPVMTIQTEFKFRTVFVISWICLLSWWGFVCYTKTIPEFKHLFEYEQGGNFATRNIVGIVTCFVTAFLLIGTIIGAVNNYSFTGTFNSGSEWISAKRFMKAVTFLEDFEVKDKIDGTKDIFQCWSSPEIFLNRAANMDCAASQKLIWLAHETMELEKINWRKAEAKAKKAEFEEFYNTMIGLLEIPKKYHLYFEQAKNPDMKNPFEKPKKKIKDEVNLAAGVTLSKNCVKA